MSDAPSHSEAETLEEYVSGRLGDLADLAMLSGVETWALERISDGTAKPDWNHERAILRALPGTPDELLHKHEVPTPRYTTTRRGSLPEGRTLRLTRAGDLVPGDLVVYHPPRNPRGSHWIEVESEPEIRGHAIVVRMGGEEIWTKADQPVRVARQL